MNHPALERCAEKIQETGCEHKGAIIVCLDAMLYYEFGIDTRAKASAAARDATPLPVTKILELALREALALGADAVGPEHLLAALLHLDDSLAARILTNHGLTLPLLRHEIRALTP